MQHDTLIPTWNLGRAHARSAGLAVTLLLAAGLTLVGGVTPAGASSSWGEGVASAPDVDGRLEVMLRVMVSIDHVWQVCAGCGWGPTVPLG